MGGLLKLKGEQPKTLQWIKIPIVSTEKCKQSGWSDAGITIGDDNICVASEGGWKSPCKGDSGGPLVCQKGNNAVITGVVSWGSGCSSSSFKPGIFAKVTYFLDWIKANMGPNPSPSPPTPAPSTPSPTPASSTSDPSTTPKAPTTAAPGKCEKPQYKNDDYCDDENNNAGCNFD